MPEAVAWARAARWPFGAVLVALDGGAVAAGAANSAEDGDMTAHAEMNLLREAAARGVRLRDHAVVSTAEPCPMCAGALLWAGVPAVAFGTAGARLTALGVPQIDLSFESVARRSSVGPRPAVARGVRADLTDPLYEELARLWRGAGGS
ncbi:tRNA-specific adenosine deaminase [Streptomyces ruber]|uniref:tRNA-specific adenosine deaminase n=3 Tax=Streptomyces TaxID=1883 RepID=A0A918EVR0_9ACTN|nr:tRNA-specific adenosine deaminase [Streptomyces ruber]